MFLSIETWKNQNFNVGHFIKNCRNVPKTTLSARTFENSAFSMFPILGTYLWAVGNNVLPNFHSLMLFAKGNGNGTHNEGPKIDQVFFSEWCLWLLVFKPGHTNYFKAEFGEEAKFLISHEIFNNRAAHFILLYLLPTWQY